MRNLATGNKTMFSIFTIIIIIIIAIVIWGINIALQAEKEEYTVSEGSYLYDTEYSLFQLENEANIKKKWNGNYYLVEKTDTLAKNLGQNTVVFSPRENEINIYGNAYRVYKDASVEKTIKRTQIVNLKEDKFYKLDDRKYLIVSNKIKNENETINTKNYLLVILDKAGNTMLINNEINSKTINQLILYTDTYKFDTANERLIFGEEIVDLKKIIGSTNQYVEREETIENDEEKKENEETNLEINPDTEQNNNDKAIDTIIDGLEEVLNNQTKINNNTNNNQQIIINNSTTNNDQIINNGNNNTSSGNSIGGNTIKDNNTTTGNNNSKDDSSSKDDQKDNQVNKTPLLKSVSLRGINTSSTYFDISYAITDPENIYQTVYINIQGDKEQTISLDKSKNTYRFLNLSPNTTYKITLGYKEIQKDGTIQDKTEDIVYARTNKINNNISISKISSNKLYFNIKLDKTYVPESAKVAMYVDGTKQDEKKINIEQGITNSGWTDYFTYSNGIKFELKIEEFIYNGKKINVNNSAKFINY